MADEGETSVAEIVASVPSIPASAQPGVVKALSYLLGGLGNYCGAWLRRPTQAVEDGTTARSIVTTALAQAAANRAAADPDLVEAALNQWAPAALNRQANKARIARQTLEELGATDEPFAADEVSDDFLNTFEKFCEDASSERMQRLWARVLAGELRSPGSFSRRTLRALYDLDARTAELFDRAAKDVVGGIIVLGEDRQNEHLEMTLELEAAGLLTGAGGILTYSINIDGRGLGFIEGDTSALVLSGAINSKISLKALPLSAVGRELLMLLPERDEQRKLRQMAEDVRSKGATGAAIARKAKSGSEGTYHLAEHLWGENPFELNSKAVATPSVDA